MENNTFYIQVAIPRPLRKLFDYLPLPNTTPKDWSTGLRVRIPFGRQTLVGIVMGVSYHSPAKNLKQIAAILDETPLIPSILIQLCFFASQYYHHPLGDVLSHALPVALRQGKPPVITAEKRWKITTAGRDALQTPMRGHKQKELLALLQQYPLGLSDSEFSTLSIDRSVLSSLFKKDWIENEDHLTQPDKQIEPSLALNKEQDRALQAILQGLGHFQSFLLEGITGSGKTEVYLQAIEACLQHNKQVLILIPEIALTPQTLSRFENRFKTPIVTLHSAMTDNQRMNAWLLARNRQAKIVIGTRSALFTPLPDLGLIIIDEEHDPSFKQQEGFRYHARDLAVYLAKQLNIPIVLGSATPSLQTYAHALQNHYQHLTLSKRAGNAMLPTFETIDLRRHAPEEGLSAPLIQKIRECITHGEQALLFLNRRGFAPSLLCHQCGHVLNCRRCDARMTVHKKIHQLRCHHCDAQRAIPSHCPECQSPQLFPIGLGTERIEQILAKHFPGKMIKRVDRDTTRTKQQLENQLMTIQSGECDILLGTQMLAKGHHFPNVTLVAILDADSGFFHCDFSATERIGQLILQVAGRAGRAEKPGTVVLQTYQPENPFLQTLIQKGYPAYAQQILEERSILSLPPKGYLALLRAEAKSVNKITAFFKALSPLLQSFQEILPLGPSNASLARKAGNHRMQLLLQSKDRMALQRGLASLIPAIDAHPLSKTVRWSVDVDPVDLM